VDKLRLDVGERRNLGLDFGFELRPEPSEELEPATKINPQNTPNPRPSRQTTTPKNTKKKTQKKRMITPLPKGGGARGAKTKKIELK